MPYLIDSDVLIDISRGKPAAREYIDALPEAWAISQISALELIVGARDNRDLADIDTFLSAYVIVPLQRSTGSRAYELLKRYAKSHGLLYEVPGVVPPFSFLSFWSSYVSLVPWVHRQ